MPLEDPNDPNVVARGKRMQDAMRYMHVLHACALQVSLAQNQPLTAGVPMASEYVPQRSQDVVTMKHLQDYFTSQGLTPP